MDCPICKLSAKDVKPQYAGDTCHINCARCGRYAISRTMFSVATNRPANFKLSAWIRSREDLADPPLITTNSFEGSGVALPNYRLAEKQLLFLRSLERKSPFAGKRVEIIKEFDFPLAWCTSSEEFDYLIRSLVDRKLVSVNMHVEPESTIALELIVTPEGWDFLDAHAKPSQLSNQAFIAMAFADEMLPAWTDGIDPALRSVGYQPYRTDAAPHIDRIDVKIMAEIRNSRLVVADVTLQRPGVYFEAGFAIGLGLPVFWSVREDDVDRVHFDTRQYNHIVWKNVEHLKEQLATFVYAVVGKGTAA